MNSAVPIVKPKLHRARPDPRLTVFLLGTTVAWVVLWFVHTLGYWEDDAYIHLEFARSLTHGQGFSFNGHIVYGDTSPLWVWLLCAVHACLPHGLLPGWMAAGKTLAALAAIFALCGAFAFAQSLIPHPGLGPDPASGKARSRAFAAAMLLVLVVNPYFGYWAFSGMEALAAAGLVCWGLLAATGDAGNPFTRPIAPRRFLLGCLCAGLAPLLRPEMGFFTLLLGSVLFVRWVNLPAAFRPKLLLFFSGFLLVAGPGLAWGFYAVHTFGSLLPNTNAAKRAGPHDSVALHLLGIYAFGFPMVLLGLLALGLLALSVRFPGRRIGKHAFAPGMPAGSFPLGGWLLLVWTAVNCLFYVEDHTYVQTRYIFVTAPVLTIVLLALACRWFPTLYRAGTIFGILFGVSVSLLTTWPLIANKVAVDREYIRLALFLRTLPPHDAVAHYSIGEAAFISEHPIIDLGGITRPGVIAFLWDANDHRLIWWMHQQGARYAVFSHSPEPGSTLVWQTDLPVTGWYLNRKRYGRTEHMEVWKLPASPTVPLPPDMSPSDQP